MYFVTCMSKQSPVIGPPQCVADLGKPYARTFVRYADVFDRVPAHVTRRHPPKPVPVFGGTNNLLQMHVHPRIARNEVAVVGLAVLQFHQLSGGGQRKKEWLEKKYEGVGQSFV